MIAEENKALAELLRSLRAEAKAAAKKRQERIDRLRDEVYDLCVMAISEEGEMTPDYEDWREDQREFMFKEGEMPTRYPVSFQEREAPFYMVWVENQRAPVVKHPTFGEAFAEAERLLNLKENEGRRAYVVVPLRVGQVKRPPIEWTTWDLSEFMGAEPRNNQKEEGVSNT